MTTELNGRGVHSLWVSACLCYAGSSAYSWDSLADWEKQRWQTFACGLNDICNKLDEPPLVTALESALEFIEDYEDVSDGNDGYQVPNRAMSLAAELRAVLAKARGE